MNILVLNCGSSSIKFQVITTDQRRIEADSDRCLAKGSIERIGSLSLVSFHATGRAAILEETALRDYRSALDRIVRWVISPGAGIDGVRSLADIHAIGHRVVHGGPNHVKPELVTPALVGIHRAGLCHPACSHPLAGRSATKCRQTKRRFAGAPTGGSRRNQPPGP